MKLHTLLLALSLPVVFAACGKKNAMVPVEGPLYSGKVLKTACGQAAIQITDGSRIGQNGWNDEGRVYDHVFAVANTCNWRPKGGTSENIRFRFVAPTPQDCAQCKLYLHVPETAYYIVVEE